VTIFSYHEQRNRLKVKGNKTRRIGLFIATTNEYSVLRIIWRAAFVNSFCYIETDPSGLAQIMTGTQSLMNQLKFIEHGKSEH